jgi:hypothetical protein
MAAEQCLDAGKGPPSRCDGQLLAGDLEQQGTVEIHRRQLLNPRPGVEIRPVADEPGQHRVGMAQIGARLPQPRSAVGVVRHVPSMGRRSASRALCGR